MKSTSYKTNQLDSLQMETKVRSQLRSYLILCLSSDSMWSHPEIPHKPHLLSIWPRSHAIRSCMAARDSRALLWCAFAEKNESTWRRNTRHEGWDWSSGIQEISEDNSTEAAIAYWSVVNLSCEFIVLYECVLWLFLPDDEISLPADQVTYKVICGDLTSTYIPSLHPLCHHSYILADFLSSNNL